MLLIPSCFGQNGRNISYRYANRYNNNLRSTSGKISAYFGSFRPISAEMRISAGSRFCLFKEEEEEEEEEEKKKKKKTLKPHLRCFGLHCFSFNFNIVSLSHHTFLLLTFPLLENT